MAKTNNPPRPRSTPSAASDSGAGAKGAPVKSVPQPMPAADPYIVGDCPMRHDGELYLPGDQIWLTPEQALRSARRVSAPAADFPQLNQE